MDQTRLRLASTTVKHALILQHINTKNIIKVGYGHWPVSDSVQQLQWRITEKQIVSKIYFIFGIFLLNITS